MIKVSLSRDEIEEAIKVYVKEILSYGILEDNDIKISQGKSATATIVIIPKSASKEEANFAVSEAEKEIETIAGQPEPVHTTTTFG